MLMRIAGPMTYWATCCAILGLAAEF
jgi:hypothetical protein